MATIEIKDLPPLEELSPEEVEQILGAGRIKKARLGLESLEDRMMPVIGALAPPVFLDPADSNPEWNFVSTGVVKISGNPVANNPYSTPVGGTGTLLWSGRHILTSSQMLANIPESWTVLFQVPGEANPRSMVVDWSAAVSKGELVILELPSQAPLAANRHELYSGGNEKGSWGYVVGTGAVGHLNENNQPVPHNSGGGDWYPHIRGANIGITFGTNTIDKVGDDYLQFDFDKNGQPPLGSTVPEVMFGHSDWGGPTFINWGSNGKLQIAGVHVTNTHPRDPWAVPYEYGERFFDARLSADKYRDWITSVVDGRPSEFVIDVSKESNPVHLKAVDGNLRITSGQWVSERALDKISSIRILGSDPGADGIYIGPTSQGVPDKIGGVSTNVIVDTAGLNSSITVDGRRGNDRFLIDTDGLNVGVQVRSSGTVETIYAAGSVTIRDLMNDGTDHLEVRGTGGMSQRPGRVNLNGLGYVTYSRVEQVTLTGKGASSLIFDDVFATSTEYVLDRGQLQRTSRETVHYAGFQKVTLNAGSGNDSFQFLQSAPGVSTVINAGEGHDTIIVGNSGTLSGIGQLTFDGQGGNDTVHFNNSANGRGGDPTRTGWSYTLTSAYEDPGLSRLTFGPLSSNTTNSQFSLPPNVIDFRSAHAALSTGAGNDVINIVKTQSGHHTRILAGAGNDAINVGNGYLSWVNALTIYGEAGFDTLTVNNSWNSQGHDYAMTNSWDIEQQVLAIIFGPRNSSSRTTLGYRDIDKVDLYAGPGNDIVKPLHWSQGTNRANIFGGSGIDTLDYSSYTSWQPVWVNLQLRQADDLTSVNSFENFLGGAGDDFLVGTTGNNVLVGGGGADSLYGSAGRDILIGGAGNDRLFGGSGEDILIGASTSYDNNATALEGFLADWGSNLTFAQRRTNLTAGTASGYLSRGRAVGNSLSSISLSDAFWGQPRPSRSMFRFATLFEDGALDDLFGGDGSQVDGEADWFFASNDKRWGYSEDNGDRTD